MNAAVHCTRLVHVYRVLGTDVAALRGVDLRVDPGETVALLGPSGSGKSTLLTVVAGILRPSAGTVTVMGTDLGAASHAQLHRLRAGTLGLMLQGAATNLLLYADAQANVALAERAIPAKHPDSGRHGSVGAHVLHALGLDRDRRPVAALSASQQQGVALAVALSTTPRLLLADEPTSQLDDQARDDLLGILLQMAAEHEMTVLLVTHDQHVAQRMGRMVHLRDGRVGAEATRHERFAVVGADGSIQLPEDLQDTWPGGSLVRVDGAGPDEIRISRAEPRP